MTVKIDPEFRDLIPPPSEEERRILESKLAAEGCREQLVGWDNDPGNPGGVTLVEGHTRQAICERLGIGYGVRPMKFGDRHAVKLWIINNQLGRRNLTDDQRSALAFHIMREASECERRERSAKANEARHAESSLSDTVADKEKPRPKRDTRKDAAKAAKVSERKVRNVAAVAKKAPELVKKIADGEVTISQAKKLATPKPPPAQPAPVDLEGNSLPDIQAVQDAFAARWAVSEALTAFTQLSGALNRMWETPAAARILPSRQRVEAHVQEARQIVRDYQPHAVCSDCRGKGNGCGRCGGLGWITKEAAKRREDAAKARQGVA